jgi:hypothetical protein
MLLASHLRIVESASTSFRRSPAREHAEVRCEITPEVATVDARSVAFHDAAELDTFVRADTSGAFVPERSPVARSSRRLTRLPVRSLCGSARKSRVRSIARRTHLTAGV